MFFEKNIPPTSLFKKAIVRKQMIYLHKACNSPSSVSAPCVARLPHDALEKKMDKLHKEALQVTKELVAKFIETRTISPSNFPELFPMVYGVVLKTLDASEDETNPSSRDNNIHGGGNN